jgi:hypothetical protein
MPERSPVQQQGLAFLIQVKPRGIIMRTSGFALATLVALGFSGAALAEEATTGPVASTGPATMTDAELDGVAAGTVGQGIDTAFFGPGQAAKKDHNFAQGLKCCAGIASPLARGKLTAPGQ